MIRWNNVWIKIIIKSIDMSKKIFPTLGNPMEQSKLEIKDKNEVVIVAEEQHQDHLPTAMASSITISKDTLHEAGRYGRQKKRAGGNKRSRIRLDEQTKERLDKQEASNRNESLYLGEAVSSTIISSERKLGDKSSRRQNLYICEICCRQLPESTQLTLNCGHQFCQQCLIFCAAENLKSYKPIKCPNDLCKRLINLRQAKYLQKLPANLYRKYKRYSLSLSLLNRVGQAMCPNEQCDDGVVTVQRLGNQDEFAKETKCEKCGNQICSRCLMPPHQIYISCKSWKNQFSEIQNMNNYCQCEKCSNIIEKSEGCNQMTCHCDYEFCFACGGRWRQFHLCNPFYYQQHRRQNPSQEHAEPSCGDYAYYLVTMVGKVLWAVFSVVYILPLLLLGYALSEVGLFVGLVVMGITYGYGCYVKEIIQNSSVALGLLYILLIPLGMTNGICRVFKSHCNLFYTLSKLMIKLADLSLPFNWIPFSCLT